MMRSRIHLVLFLMVIFFSNCDGFLNNKPSNHLLLNEAYKTGNDLKLAINGVYDLMRKGGLSGRNLIVFPDLMGGNCTYQGIGWTGLENIASFQMLSTDGYAEKIWLNAYQVINQVNQILELIPSVMDNDVTFTIEVAQQIEGEALFFRGLLYFELVRLFALPYGHIPEADLGLPILLEPITSISEITFPIRQTVEQTYNQAINDLTNASLLLSNDVIRGGTNRYAALAFLAKIAFQQQQYERVTQLTNEIIHGPFLLANSPHAFFNQQGFSEEIFTLIGGSPGAMFRAMNLSTDIIEYGFEKIITTGQFINLHDAGYSAVDLRFDTLGINQNYSFVLADSLLYKTNKYFFQNEGESDVPVARLAEFMLMHAEARAHIEGINEESLEWLNRIRQRSIKIINEQGQFVQNQEALISFQLSDFESTEDLINSIKLERRVELAFEGNYFHDLMRCGLSVKNIPYDDDALRFPIPQREIDTNPNLQQNPGY